MYSDISARANYTEFLFNARKYLATRRADVYEQVLGGNLGEGKWHPNGFAVFHLETIPEVGNLRLHFWPFHLRRKLENHPTVHAHSWPLYSEVLSGVYRDSRYVVTPDKEGESNQYVVRYGKPDFLEMTDERFRVEPFVESIWFKAGTSHQLEPGKFHSSPIPGPSFCATLCVMGERVPGIEDTMVGDGKLGSVFHTRPKVSGYEKEAIVHQFTQRRRLDNYDALQMERNVMGLG